MTRNQKKAKAALKVLNPGLFFETGFLHVTQAGLELREIHLPLALGIKVCTMSDYPVPAKPRQQFVYKAKDKHKAHLSILKIPCTDSC